MIGLSIDRCTLKKRNAELCSQHYTIRRFFMVDLRTRSTPFGNHVDHGICEPGQIVWFSAADEMAIHNHGLVLPNRARIDQVVLDPG